MSQVYKLVEAMLMAFIITFIGYICIALTMTVYFMMETYLNDLGHIFFWTVPVWAILLTIYFTMVKKDKND